MAELADALDSGSNGRKAVQVQVLSPAPHKKEAGCYKTVGFFFCVVFFNKSYIKKKTLLIKILSREF